MEGGLYNPRPVDDVPVNGQLTHGVTSNWAFDHEADLDAHIRDQFEVLRIGDTYVLPLFHTGNVNRAITANRLYGIFFVVPRLLTVDRIAIAVQTLAGGTSARLGIYNVGANLYPGALLLDAGVVSTATTGVKAIVINQQLAKGVYFGSWVSDGTPTLYCSATVRVGLGADPGNWAGVNYGGWYVAQAYGALPDPFTAGGTLDSGFFACRLRASSMD